ncbi:MAG: cob(I)yrinic acid a,c-diamide adenosyltransferase [Micromonosporaceae bacterium]|nr:cob(I)yrinic acid a,c-diamide adenosyltransferase [Micromonosporaceae bacterium]
MRGKSTAAFGLALRAWAAGLPVGVYQFVKSGKWRPGEEAALLALGRVHAETGEGASVTWHTLGQGWLTPGSHHATPTPACDPAPASDTSTKVNNHRMAAVAGWRAVQRDLAAAHHGCLVLDELTYPIAWGWLDAGEVIETIRSRPGFQHVIVTGRDADQRLIEAADLVVEMTKVKHPFDTGRRGQRGIEW